MWAGASEGKSPGIIGIPRRSLWSPDQAIQQAALAARGNIHPCPVVHHGQILGIIRGESPYSPRVKWKPTPWRLGYTDYNDLISEFVNKGKAYQATSFRTPSTANVATTWYDLWTCGTYPAGATLGGAAATANKYDDTDPSAMLAGGNVSPDTKFVLSVQAQQGTNSGCFLLYDRVLDYQSCAYTAAANQAMTNTNTAQRYNVNGTPGLQMTWGADTLHDGTASIIQQVQYTNNAGATLHNMPTTPQVNIIVSATASSATLGYRINGPATAGTTLTWGAFLPLAQGDTGARLVDNYTTSAVNSGTFVLALIYPLAYLPVASGPVPNQIDQLFHRSIMERVYDGACLAWMRYTGINSGTQDISLAALLGWG